MNVVKVFALAGAASISAMSLAGCASAQATDADSRAHDRPNIVVILADDMGIGDPRCYNPESCVPTPCMDALAATGVRFTDAHSPSAVCTPTRYALLTGRYAWRSRLKRGVLVGDSRALIEPGRPTIPSMLKQHGYDTAFIGKWHLGLGAYDPEHPDRKTDFSQPLDAGPHTIGFDSSFYIPASLDFQPYVYLEDDHVTAPLSEHIEKSERRSSGGGGFWRAGAIAPGFTHEGVLPTLTDRAEAYIRSRVDDDDPFFLYFALPAPHTPWMPTDEFQGKSQAGWYGDFVHQVDDTVGRVLDALDAIGEADNTLIIVTSDNGSHWRLSDIKQFGHLANGPWRGMKADIHEGGHRVPFIVRWPGHTTAGRTCDAMIGLHDLYDTFGAIVGHEDGAGESPDSVSFLPSLIDGRAQVRAHLVNHSINGTFALRWDDWKLIECLGSGGFTPPKKREPAEGEAPGQLYNMRADPGETKNRYAEQPEVVARMKKMLDDVRADPQRR
jgi:arylsulfatase A